MKKYLIIASLIIIGIIGIGYNLNKNKIPAQSSVPIQKISEKNDETQAFSFDDTGDSQDDINPTYPTPSTEINFDKINIQTITTTEQLQQLFPKFYLYAVSPIFIEQFPVDFPEKGNINLFVKAMMPLILREQNNILADREFLLSLNQKPYLDWTNVERARFDALIQKYELTKEKLSVSQMDELLKRVDIIPMSLVLAVSGIHTNWGQKNLTAPFGQKEWVKGKYIDKQFDLLGDAVHAFMHELNTLAIYAPMRTARQTNRHLKGSLGEKLLSHMDNYMRENPTYERQIKDAFKTLKLGVLDEALLFE